MQTKTNRPEDDQEIAERQKLRSDQVFEILRRDGEEELGRPASSLAWSGLAAGMAIGFSVLTEAVMKSRLPDAEWAALIADAGYSVGFLIVILGKFQLFTENTITPVLPICHRPTAAGFARLLRIWTLVLAANVAGAVLFATFMLQSGAAGAETVDAMLALGRHAADDGFWTTLARGVGAGFLIAALVWILAELSGAAAIAAIILITYVIAIAGFAHIVAGAVEMALLVLGGTFTLTQAVFGFMLPALIGNMLGGTALFTMLAYAQIRREIDPE